MDLLTIALIVVAAWFMIAIVLALALVRAAGHSDEVTARLVGSREIASSRSREEIAALQIAPLQPPPVRRTWHSFPHPRVHAIRRLMP